MPSIFSRIVAGEIPCHKIAETDDCLAFLDIGPVARGHTLVIPKLEVDYIFEVEDDLLEKMIVFAKRVGKAIEQIVPCARIGITVIGLEVPHAHIHLIPINGLSDMDFTKPKVNMSNEEMAKLAKDIGAAVNQGAS